LNDDLHDNWRVPVKVSLVLPWCFLILISGATITVSVVPGETNAGDLSFQWLVSITPSLLQNSMHVAIYGLLAWKLDWVLHKTVDFGKRRLVVLALCSILGATMEWLQMQVPGRNGTFFDIGLNTVGVYGWAYPYALGNDHEIRRDS
jgi:hypothetical protein